MEETRQAQIYGVRPSRTFEQAAARFVIENQHKRSIDDDAGRLKGLMPWIGRLPLDGIHMGSLQPWIEQRRREGVSVGPINHGMKIVRRIVNLASTEWIDEHGLSWLLIPPKVRLLPDTAKRQLIRLAGGSNLSCFANYQIIWRKWRYLPLTPDAEIAKFAARGGLGKRKSPNWILRYSSSLQTTSRTGGSDSSC
jgi:hypothetical protein